MFDRLAPDVENWIRETARGVEISRENKDGSITKARLGADPAKAADLTLRMAEFHVPKLASLKVGGDGEAPITVRVDRND